MFFYPFKEPPPFSFINFLYCFLFSILSLLLFLLTVLGLFFSFSSFFKFLKSQIIDMKAFFLSFFLKFIYLFIYSFIFGCIGSLLLHAGFLQLRRVGSTLHCGARASDCGGFSCCRAWNPGVWASVVVARGLQSAGSVVVAHKLQGADSVVVAHGLSCSTACGIFLDQGLNPCPLHWQVDSQPLHHQGSPKQCIVILWLFSRFSLSLVFSNLIVMDFDSSSFVFS